MSFHVPANQSVCWSVYKAAIAEQTRLPNDFLQAQMPRINKAFDRGEPIWMICDELKIVYQTRPARLDVDRNPAELAIVRMVMFGDD
jgi:hypothetical protein